MLLYILPSKAKAANLNGLRLKKQFSRNPAQCSLLTAESRQSHYLGFLSSFYKIVNCHILFAYLFDQEAFQT